MIKTVYHLLAVFLSIACFFQASYAATISGRVTNSSSLQPIEGVTVSAISGAVTVLSTISDSAGNYTLNLSSGVYDIHAGAAGYLNNIYTNIPAIETFSTTRNIELTPTLQGTLSGKIVRAVTLDPVSSATIEARKGSVLTGSTTSDLTGNYSLTLTTGTYNITVSREGFTGQAENNVLITQLQTTTLNFTLEIQQVSKDTVVLHNNVFDMNTNIKFPVELYLTRDSNIDVRVISPKGEVIKILSNEYRTSGQNVIYWDGKNDSGNNVLSGMYIVYVKTNTLKTMKKIVLIR